MPELPEVETLRRSLAPRLTGRTVVQATLHRRDVAALPGDPAGGFSRQRGVVSRPKRVRPIDLLAGRTLAEPARRGKQLGLIGIDGGAIVVHLGMTGRVQWVARGARLGQADHVHATWRLDDGSRVVFRDPRRFGGLWLLPDRAALESRWAALGPDALTADPSEVARALGGGSVRAVKAAMLDQGVIAGVGNIYADESLFLAGVAPQTPVGALGNAEASRIAGAVRTVMEAAVEAGGSTLRDYADGEGRAGSAQLAHRVYGRGGSPCVTCGNPLSAGTVAQRTTVWCECCQPATP